MDNNTDQNNVSAKSKRSPSPHQRYTGDYSRSGSAKRRHTDKCHYRSPKKKECSYGEKHGVSSDISFVHKQSQRSLEDSGFGDYECNPAGGSQKGHPTQDAPKPDKPPAYLTKLSCKQKAHHPQGKKNKKTNSQQIPWVPPPLPEHLRQIPQVTKTGFPLQMGRGTPLQNQFQNDGSFLEVFQQHMQALSTLEIQQNSEGTGLMSSSAGLDMSEIAATTAAASEPIVMKRRQSRPLKTGMVQKPKKKMEPCDSEGKECDSWSLYMKEVNKYSANKCINSQACRPLMK